MTQHARDTSPLRRGMEVNRPSDQLSVITSYQEKIKEPGDRMELLVYDGKAEFHEGVRVGASVTYVHDGHDQLNNCITTALAYHVGDTGSNSSEPM